MKSRRGRRRPGKLRRALRVVVVAAVALVAAVIAIDVHVVGSTRDRVVSVADAPPAPVAIVLGASVLRDGTPSPMLAERLRAAAALFRDGRVQRVLVSGDRDLVREYDEVSVMTAALVAAGVPRERIDEDGHGYRTLDSMCRAKEVFGVDSALVVTNAFHVPRAVYLGAHFGIDVHGVAADRDVDHPIESRARNVGREVLARILAWADCHILDTRPRVDPARPRD